MTLSRNEIKDRTLKFSKDWADETSEKAGAQTFWNEFFNVFGISRKRVATFETKVKKLDGKDGYIDQDLRKYPFTTASPPSFRLGRRNPAAMEGKPPDSRLRGNDNLRKS